MTFISINEFFRRLLSIYWTVSWIFSKHFLEYKVRIENRKRKKIKNVDGLAKITTSLFKCRVIYFSQCRYIKCYRPLS